MNKKSFENTYRQCVLNFDPTAQPVHVVRPIVPLDPVPTAFRCRSHQFVERFIQHFFNGNEKRQKMKRLCNVDM